MLCLYVQLCLVCGCIWQGWDWERLDGTTGGQERADAIKRFNDPGGFRHVVFGTEKPSLCCCSHLCAEVGWQLRQPREA
jgi:hypothetical protein